ncbi:winged helix-turn-helix domain-containing protein [Nocardioides islandensis]|uniref:Winged helix-turn-helix domain-containing protein n=1 Tax=Nocardioides islandensis TaxID=433663 RepID=A0A930YDX6_9ACTN|nr:BTAD domain-containing putative transcriptional regulator [Nocardioides islandensis]MBF4763182.1 winged helix-turn-helix domain-containing protein [Nocardioides islandensis]
MRRLRVLGPLEVDDSGKALGPRDRVVVSALALRPGERVDAEILAEALWGEQPPPSWPKVVQGCVSRLRQALGVDAIETVAGGYRLAADRLDLDRQQFEDLVTRAEEHLARRSPERAVPLLREALALWRGPAFDSLEEWLPGRLEAVRLGQLRLSAEEDLLQARLDAGDHLGVAADGTVLTGQQPFRERRWALLALAQYRGGRQADALASIRAARRALGQELGLDPGSELVTLESRILAQDPSLAADHEVRIAGQACPWKGLEPYLEGDGDTFFGRDADVVACLARLDEAPILVVSGPSGSGKSSLVRAGLVPRLRRAGRPVAVFTPGRDGAAAMAAARQPWPGHPVLVVDQLEEAFTLGDPQEALAWLRQLSRYARESAPVVVAVRGDHVAALAAEPELARLVERGLHLVAPLDGAGVREVVEGPARSAGLRLEPGLVDLLVRDAEGQPGALPLLSHALAETWRRREDTLLTVDGYRAAGGIRDAVAASAERLYEGVSPEEQADVRWLMLHLVSLSETGEPFRTPLAADVATGLGDARRRMLDLLVRGRLVTSHAQGYDLAHEALVRAWPRLRSWLDEDRAGQQIRRHLAVAAAGWEALDRSESELYRGARLTAALDWLERGQEPLGDTERSFVDASRAAADADVRRLAQEAGRQRAQNRRLRVLVAAALALLVLAGVAWQVAVDRGGAAARGRDAATAAARTAEHESMVARSVALRASDRPVAGLLAVRAWQEQPDVLSESALLSNLPFGSGFLGYRANPFGAFMAAAEVPGQDRFLVASGTSVGLMDPVTGRTTGPVRRYLPAVEVPSVLRVSADGRRAVQLVTPSISTACPPSCPVIAVYDLQPLRAHRRAIETDFTASDVAVSPDGSLVTAVGGEGRWDVRTWETASGRLVAQDRMGVTAVAYSGPDRLLLGARTGPLREVSARTLGLLRLLPVPARTADVRILVAGRTIAVAGTRGQLALDRLSGRRLWSTAGQPGSHGCVLLTVAFRPGRLFCTTGSLVEERDPRTGLLGQTLDSQFGPLGATAVHSASDGSQILVEFQHIGASYARWNLDGPGLGARLLVPGAAAVGGYDPTGRWWLARAADGSTAIHDDQGRRVLRLPPGRAGWVSPDTVAVLGRKPVLVQIPSRRVMGIPVPGASAAYPGGGEGRYAWAVSRRGDTTFVTRFEIGADDVAGPVIELPGVEDARVAADDRRVLVTYHSQGLQGFLREWETREFDALNGAEVSRGLERNASVLLTSDGNVLSGDDDGRIVVGPEIFTDGILLARAKTAVVGVQVSRDRSRVLATSTDQDLYLVDWSSRARLGDPIPTQPPDGVRGGWLRPDGRALLINTPAGVVLWDVTPDGMVEALCALAARNPTYEEWKTFFGDVEAYDEPVCPGYPTAADQVDQTS